MEGRKTLKLENVTAEIRPRGRWESIDLGVALVQRNYKSVMLAWSLTVLPLMLLMLGGAYLWYSLADTWFDSEGSGFFNFLGVMLPFFVMWWFKPIYERVPLYVLSRSLFGEQVSVPKLVTQWPKLIVKDFFKLMVFKRFSTSRSFTMPINELEGLKGKNYKQRVSLLSRHGGDGASGLTVSCVLISHISLMTVYIAYRWLSMYGFNLETIGEHIDFFMEAMLGFYIDEQSVPSLMFALVSYIVVLSALTPFYSGAGFAIYINSRTISEGWDIELAFKRMSERLKKLRSGSSHTLLSFFICVVGIGFFSVSSAKAAVRYEENSSADRVMDEPSFDVTIKETEVPIYEESEKSDWDFSALANLGPLLNLIFWIIVIVGIGFLVWLILKNTHMFRTERTGTNIRAEERVKAKSVLGMDVTPESLPTDVIEASRKAWLEGNKKEALSYLYRGSLEWMVNAALLPVLESDTEQDCVRHVETLKNTPVETYFSKLTQVWVSQAYGNLEPEDNAIEWLCEDWPFHNKQIGGEKG